MFKKVLIANRGEIAVRIIRTCRDMGIMTVAIYEPSDISSLHVRLADECVEMASADGFMDANLIVSLAKERGVDAIHPGYGFLAEEMEFILACEAAGIAFIGPSSGVVRAARDKLGALARVRAAGLPTVESSPISFDVMDVEALRFAADELDYPLVIKSCSGGRGPGERLVRSPEQLARAMHRSQAEARAVFGNQRVYLERAVLPAQQVAVQILADQYGHVIHLGDREGSLQYGNRKIIEESPSPSLTPTQQVEICETAVSIARLFDYCNAGTVEFLVDSDGRFYFTEIKSRIQVEHPLTEMLSRLDLVREQLLIAAGNPLSYRQEDVHLRGWSMMCRINAEDPWNHFLPSPGHLEHMRIPGGPEVRIDSFVYCECDVSPNYAPLLAKLIVWGEDRNICLQRMRRALEDVKIIGVTTNLPLLQRVCQSSNFLQGIYDTDLLAHPFDKVAEANGHLQDLAVIAAVIFARRDHIHEPKMPERLISGWHRQSRRLPQ